MNFNNETVIDPPNKAAGSGGMNVLLIGVILAMTGIVVILIVVLSVICYRRSIRRQDINKKSSEVRMTVLPSHRLSESDASSSGGFVNQALVTESHSTSSRNSENAHTSLSLVLSNDEPESANYLNVTDSPAHNHNESSYVNSFVHQREKEPYINVKMQNNVQDKAYINVSKDAKTAVPLKIAVVSPTDVREVRPPIVSPRPAYTLGESSGPIVNRQEKSESTLQKDLLTTVSQQPCDSPELPKLRTRRSRDNGQPLPATDREATLTRVSNLFRSDTKAYHFYMNTVRNYEMSRRDINCDDRIGRGHFGHVYGGIASKLPNTKKRNQKIAVKTMKNSVPDSDKQEFLYELEIMKLVNSINHPNIVKLLGCVTQSQPYMIVLELMTNGNLQKFLRDTRSKDVYYNLFGNSDSLTERHLLKFAQDIAKGMEGLAELQLLHRDLATRNILLDESMTCKIADFGFAKDVLNKPEYKSKSVFQRPRPTRWLAPESLFTFKHSIRSDVWSYGVVLWEIVTLGNLPYPGMSTREVMSAIAKGYRMSCPRHCSPDIYRVMASCWEEHALDRPNFSALVEKVTELHNQASGSIDIDGITEDDGYVDTLPPQETEILIEYAASETLC